MPRVSAGGGLFFCFLSRPSPASRFFPFLSLFFSLLFFRPQLNEAAELAPGTRLLADREAIDREHERDGRRLGRADQTDGFPSTDDDLTP